MRGQLFAARPTRGLVLVALGARTTVDGAASAQGPLPPEVDTGRPSNGLGVGAVREGGEAALRAASTHPDDACRDMRHMDLRLRGPEGRIVAATDSLDLDPGTTPLNEARPRR